MTNRARRILVAVILTLAVSTGLRAQETAPAVDILTLTLDEAIARGLETSHRLQEVTARGEAAEAVVAERHAGALPQVGASVAYTRTNHVEEFGILLPNNQVRVIYPDVPDNYLTRIDALWPIYTSGRQEAIERAARIDVSAVARDGDALRADLRLEIARVYWALVTAIESARVVEDALARTGAHLIDAKNQLEAGLAAPNDVLTVEAQQARQRVLSIRASAHRDAMQADLARLVGAARGTRIQPVSVAAAVASPAARMSMEGLVAEARSSRADRGALVERLAAADARRDLAAAGMKPAIAVGGGVDYGRPNPRIFPRQEAWRHSWDASINVTWPLLDGGRSRAEIAGAAATARAIEARLAEFDSVLSVEIEQRMRDIDASRAAIDASETGVRAAAEARRVAAERFGAGVATNTDVLVAQGAVLQAELDRTEAVAGLRLAEARLARTLGR
jgi:outer membrane protein TolC